MTPQAGDGGRAGSHRGYMGVTHEPDRPQDSSGCRQVMRQTGVLEDREVKERSPMPPPETGHNGIKEKSHQTYPRFEKITEGPQDYSNCVAKAPPRGSHGPHDHSLLKHNNYMTPATIITPNSRHTGDRCPFEPPPLPLTSLSAQAPSDCGLAGRCGSLSSSAPASWATFENRPRRAKCSRNVSAPLRSTSSVIWRATA